MLPYRYSNIGLDSRQPLSPFIQSPDPHQQRQPTSSIHSTDTTPSPSPSQQTNRSSPQISTSPIVTSKIKSASSSPTNNNNSRTSIDGMANLTPTLLSSSVPFSAQQQLQSQSSGAIQQQMVQTSGISSTNRSRVKNRSSNNATSHLNGLASMPAQQIFGTSVAFPGNPLQSAGSGQVQNQNYQHQSRSLNQMQHSAGGQPSSQTVLLPLEINPSQTRNLVANNSTGANSITSNSAAAVAAAVAVAHPQYTQYITSWPCPACKISFRAANELQAHLSAHFVPSQKQTQNQNSLVSVPNTINNNLFTNKTTTTKEDQSVHAKKDKSVPCNECGKLFANSERVRVHVRVAHGEKTCSCAICGCGFSYRCKLLNHMRTHTGDKPFTCEVCGRSFSQKNHLKRHHMIHTGERPFPCEICGRSFYRKDKLTRHLRIHTNPSPGRGRNAKVNQAAAAAAVAAAASSNSAVKLPMGQIPSTPAIQLLPNVTMNAKNAPTTQSSQGSGQTSWAQLQQSTSNQRQPSNQHENENIGKTDEQQSAQQQSSNLMTSSVD